MLRRLAGKIFYQLGLFKCRAKVEHEMDDSNGTKEKSNESRTKALLNSNLTRVRFDKLSNLFSAFH